MQPTPTANRGGTIVITVNSAYDDDPDTNGDGTCAGPTFGECQLRSAINEANAYPDSQPVTIAFNIITGPTGSQVTPGRWRITLAYDGTDTDTDPDPLPFIFQDGLTIDGLTQPGSTCGYLPNGSKHDLRVLLDGSNVVIPEIVSFAYGSGINARAGGLTVRGLVIWGFPNPGVFTQNFNGGTPTDGTDTLVECNYIGTDYTGEVAQGNTSTGVIFATGTARNNLVSGNGFAGITAYNRFGPSVSQNILDNLIGTDADGLEPLGNSGPGIYLLESTGALISGNTVSANGENGMLLGGFFSEGETSNMTVYDNRVGLTRGGQSAGMGNAFHGIVMWASSSQLGHPDFGPNRIADNGLSGILLGSSDADDAVIQHNTIGMDLNGNPAPNGEDGIQITSFGADGPDRLLIGGYTAGISNIIRHNTRDGIRIEGNTAPQIVGNTVISNGGNGITLTSDPDSGPTTNALIYANSIGTDGGGSDFGNAAHGLHCIAATGSSVGSHIGYGNTIQFNGGDGVAVEAGCADLAILRNQIADNDGLGIDIGTDGVSPNDSPEADGVTNHPVMTSATNDGSQSVVVFDFEGVPGDEYLVQVFTSDSPDPSGFGEGWTLATETQFDLGPTGRTTLTMTRTVSQFPLGSWVTATATRVNSPTDFEATSEFSNAEQVIPPPPYTIQIRPIPPPPPIVVPLGGRFDYEMTITAREAGTTQVWTRAQFPSGTTTKPIFGPRTLTLAAGEVRVINARQRIPTNVPTGSYEYFAYVGADPRHPVDSDGFGVTVAPSRPAPQGDEITEWEVEVLSDEAEMGKSTYGLDTSVERLALSVGPNPSRGDVSVRFGLEEASRVRVEVYDALGREVAVLADETYAAGAHEARLRARTLPAGTYLVRLRTEEGVQTCALTLTR